MRTKLQYAKYKISNETLITLTSSKTRLSGENNCIKFPITETKIATNWPKNKSGVERDNNLRSIDT